MQTPTEEVYDSLNTTFHSWLKNYEDGSVNGINSVSCTNSHAMKVDDLDRTNLKISVKVFLESLDTNDLKNSVSQVMSDLDITIIDSLVLALPPFKDGSFSLGPVKPLWSELEKLVKDGKVVTIGISDLDANELAELYNWTEIKPSVNQVNLESCCVMPPELIAFAKEKDIQLLTHNDSKILLPDTMFHKILEPAVPTPKEWKINWIVRYSIVVKCRGIIQNKGYLLRSVKTT
ncbi:hypothetical protein JTE90_014060 [Oedothorax gibbosus]|uniref:GCS light chain n=1 Tax=Oedothorax gibbosus TaxID=931172 RepID=A0AAV6V3X7_9ARAC|nr:hypothetical protein JTE90_014060 [Oedothorax gibbosus]